MNEKSVERWLQSIMAWGMRTVFGLEPRGGEASGGVQEDGAPPSSHEKARDALVWISRLGEELSRRG